MEDWLDELDGWVMDWHEGRRKENGDRMFKAEGYISDLVIEHWSEIEPRLRVAT